MINIQSEQQALDLLTNTQEDVFAREAAIYYLGHKPTKGNLAHLVRALEDSEFGVRWVAAVVLAEVGDDALLPLLQGLTEQHDSAWLREGTHHVLHYSSSQKVREQTAALQKALRGPAVEMATMHEAAKLLPELSV